MLFFKTSMAIFKFCTIFSKLPLIFIDLPISFAHSFRRNNVVGHRKKEKLLCNIKIECMCDES